jgi:hypothetical protein
LTFFTGLASDGEAWVGYSRRVGWTTLNRVSSSSGQRFICIAACSVVAVEPFFRTPFMTSLSLSLTSPRKAANTAVPLDWVGMCGIALPLQWKAHLSAHASAGVSLDEGSARGIHMSRLYLALEALEHQPLSLPLIRQTLEQFLFSHQGLSSAAYLRWLSIIC